MKTKLYAAELMRKLVTPDELRVLEIIWDSELSTEEKIVQLVEGE